MTTQSRLGWLGDYRLIAALGEGGMAAVHLAVAQRASGFNKLVVLKEILPQYAADPNIVGMFLDEARLSARMSHPNVVQTNEVGLEGGRHFLAMDYLDGQPLNRVIKRLNRHGGLPLVMHLQLIADLLAGAHYVHELLDYDGSLLGVVHCDVGPQNTFITYDGGVKLVDFGIATSRTATNVTPVGLVRGKIAYMAPEQMRGDPLDRRADVFAAGVMLWEAATGMRPWARTSDYVIATRVLAGQFPAPRASNPAVSAALEAIILKATSFDRRERHATAAELQLEIEAHLHTLGGRLPQRDLGELVANSFAGERTVIAAVIAEQLELCAAAHSDAELPAQLALLPTLAGIAPLDSGIVDVASLAAADDEDAEASASPAALPARADATQGRGRVRLLTAATAVLAAAVVVASMSFVFGRASAPPARIVEPAPTVATASSAAAEPRPTVDLELSALPLHAHFVLDETPLVGNPYRGALPRDGAEHRLRTEATGFVPRVQSVLLDRDRGIEIVLAAEPGGTHGRHAGSADPPEERPHPSDGPPHAPPTIKW